MNGQKLHEIKSNLEAGILVSRPAWEEVIASAIAMDQQRNRFAQLIVEKLAPQYVRDSNGPDGWACQCCLAESKAGPDERPRLSHDLGCLFLEASKAYSSAVVQHSGESAFGAEPIRLMGKDRWDSASIEAHFHKQITFLTKREQGYVMGAFREVLEPIERERRSAGE